MFKKDGKDERYEKREIDPNSPEAANFSYKSELPLKPDELALLGKEDGYLRFVRFKGEPGNNIEQIVVIDAKVGPDFAFDMARALKGKEDAIELLKEVLNLVEMFDSPIGPVLENLYKLKRAFTETTDAPGSDLCPCPKCTEKRARSAAEATGGNVTTDPLQN